MNGKQRRELQAEFDGQVSVLLGSGPVLSDFQRSSSGLDRASVWIDKLGGVVTRLAGEVIQAGAVLVLLVFFAALEFERVKAGALALEQKPSSAVLIALALVVGNVVHPVYRLREHRAAGRVVVRRGSLRLWLRGVWRRLVGVEYETIEHDQHYNPVLGLAALVITWATVLFAMYDLLQPILRDNGASWASFAGVVAIPGTALKLAAGLLASVGGVAFLQAASHEIGVRMLVSRPASAVESYERARAEYEVKRAALYERVKADFLARVEPERGAVVPVALPLFPGSNGHKHG